PFDIKRTSTPLLSRTSAPLRTQIRDLYLSLTGNFRYWDTDVTNGPNNWCNGIALQCDEHFVFSGKFTY
ncbi:MAG: hypothetical protein ABL901_15045, partial [Hyphomicrobiaceae bacterium]